MYDITLEAALRAQSCGPNQLVVTGEWHWLLSQYANTYGIRDFYARLSHLRWILRYGAMTREEIWTLKREPASLQLNWDDHAGKGMQHTLPTACVSL